ncbi:MAG: rRNA maturation RNase YbeY [Bacteriovoracaceae bacterium]
MTIMKKHPFLQVDFVSTVKLSKSEQAKIAKWLNIASEVMEKLVERKIIKSKVSQMSVSLLICGDAKIKQINKEFRQKDKVTDVLSFPSLDNLRNSHLKTHEIFLGDLAICHGATKRQAKEFSISYFDEFIHLFFHGVIHLLGYDHEISEKEEKLMQKWEDLALKLFSEIKKGAYDLSPKFRTV